MSWRHTWEVEVYLHSFLTSELDGGGWSTSLSARFILRNDPGTRRIGGWVGPRDGLEILENRKNSLLCQDSNTEPSSP